MISKFLNTLKNSGTLTLGVSVAFLCGVVISAYLLFTLPHQLILVGGLGLHTLELAWPGLIALFIAISLTFILGFLAINAALHSRIPVIVYLERKKEMHSTAAEQDEVTAEAGNDLAGFKAMLEQTKDSDLLQNGLNVLCRQFQAGQGALYQARTEGGKKVMSLRYGFAFVVEDHATSVFEWGEGLIGQVAASGRTIYLDEVPEGYMPISSGLGTSSPRHLLIVPMKKDGEVTGVVEIATFSPVPNGQRDRIEERVCLLAEKMI